LFLLNFFAGFSQIADPGFARYLTSQGNFNDVLLLQKFDWEKLDAAQLDSLNYYSGWASYNLQLLEQGIRSFSLVSPESGFYNASRFLAGWSELYLGQTLKGMAVLSQSKPESAAENELLYMLRTSGALMQHDVTAADSVLNMIRNTKIKYSTQWDRMEEHYDRLSSFKPRSYALAGLFSAILPGAGKVYADQRGAGVSSFLLVGALAAVSLENGIKTGWKRWNTLLSASVFSVFYIGNVYGSIVSVKVYRDRFYDELDRAILLDVNIPLRDLYR